MRRSRGRERCRWPQLKPACWQTVDLPKQKHSVQPLLLSAAKPNVPSLHALHCRPMAFSCRQNIYFHEKYQTEKKKKSNKPLAKFFQFRKVITRWRKVMWQAHATAAYIQQFLKCHKNEWLKMPLNILPCRDTDHCDRNDRGPRDTWEYHHHGNCKVCISDIHSSLVHIDHTWGHRSQRDMGTDQTRHIATSWILVCMHKTCIQFLALDYKILAYNDRNARPRLNVDKHNDLCLDHKYVQLFHKDHRLQFNSGKLFFFFSIWGIYNTMYWFLFFLFIFIFIVELMRTIAIPWQPFSEKP